jgi:hypothetical protein
MLRGNEGRAFAWTQMPALEQTLDLGGTEEGFVAFMSVDQPAQSAYARSVRRRR